MDTDFIHSGLKGESRMRKVRKARYKRFLLSVVVGEGTLTSLWALCHFTPRPLPLESSLLLFHSEIQIRQMAPVDEMKHE